MFLHAHTTMTYLHCGPFISQCSTSICQSSVIPTYMYIKHAITLIEYQISYEVPTIPWKFLTIWYQESHQLFSCKEWKEWWMRFVETWESIQAYYWWEHLLLVYWLTVVCMVASRECIATSPTPHHQRHPHLPMHVHCSQMWEIQQHTMYYNYI